MNKVTLFIFYIVINVSLCCQINTNNNSVTCATVEDLLNIKKENIYDTIIVESSENDKLVVLNSTAFNYMKNVQHISIFGNNILDIKSNTFNGLPIKTVIIMDNMISTIKSNIFTDLPVEELTLINNNIQFIENEAFAHMQYLKKLNLHKNQLTAFDTNILLQNTSSLEVLILSNNNLKSILKDTFNLLKNLQTLRLNNNKLETLDSNCFDSLPKLTTLDISSNNIKELNSKSFPENGVQALTNLYLHNNQLCFLEPDLLQRLPNLKTLSYSGNPWQCPCWQLLNLWISKNNITRICHEDYAAGQKPECVVTDFAPMHCVYDKDKLNDVVEIFLAETEAYGINETCLIV